MQYIRSGSFRPYLRKFLIDFVWSFFAFTNLPITQGTIRPRTDKKSDKENWWRQSVKNSSIAYQVPLQQIICYLFEADFMHWKFISFKIVFFLNGNVHYSQTIACIPKLLYVHICRYKLVFHLKIILCYRL